MTTLAAKPAKPVKKPLFDVVETEFGIWKTYKDGNRCNSYYSEFTSHAHLLGRPLVSIVNGIDPRTKQWAKADGFIAIGQRATGVIAIGQFCSGGVLAVGQFCCSRFLAIGQFSVAPVAIGQFSLAAIAIAQLGIAGTGLFQEGLKLWPMLLSFAS